MDAHNRHRHDSLHLEKKIETKDWSKRVNLSILGMIIVDSFLIYKQLGISNEKASEFYKKLVEELIDNEYDSI